MSSPAGWSTSSLSSSEPERAFSSPRPSRASGQALAAPLSRAWRGAYDGSLYRRAFGLLLPAFMLVVAACGGGDDTKGIAITTQVPSRSGTPETRTPIGLPPVAPTTTAPAPVVGGEAVAFQSADGAV